MIRINLLPQDARKRTPGTAGLDKTKVIPFTALGLVVAGCIATITLQNAKLSSVEQEVASARAEAEQYKKTIALINDMVQREAELNRRLTLVRTLDENRFRTVKILDQVSQTVPHYLWLTSLKNISPDRVAIEGYAFSNLVVSDLMTRLEDSNMFDDVQLTVAKRRLVDGQNAVNFTVTSSVSTSADTSATGG
ncbi:MAG: PilN domain-containing protein [bacterium]